MTDQLPGAYTDEQRARDTNLLVTDLNCRCTCGHLRRQHAGMLMNAACDRIHCLCNRFTFAGRDDADTQVTQLQRDLASARTTIEWLRESRRLVGSRQHFTLPNNLFGRAVLAVLRRALNHTSYRIVTRGRRQRWYVRPWNRLLKRVRLALLALDRDHTPRAAQRDRLPITQRLLDWTNAHMIYVRQDVPKRHAQRLGVYIDRKPVPRGQKGKGWQ